MKQSRYEWILELRDAAYTSIRIIINSKRISKYDKVYRYKLKNI